MELIQNELKKIGLGDYESLIYSTLLKISPATASVLARKCNLSRSSVYTTLNSLIAKGLVGTSFKNETKQFIAQDLSVLEERLKKEKDQIAQKFKVFESLKQNLQSITNQNLNLPQVIFFEGQEGLKKIYLSMMVDAPFNSTLYLIRNEFVWQPLWQFIFDKDWHERVKYHKTQKNISTKLLINNSKVENQNLEVYQSRKELEFKFLPAQDSVTDFAMYIIGDVVSILSMENNNLVGIKITNQNLADNFKKIFDSVWSKT